MYVRTHTHDFYRHHQGRGLTHAHPQLYVDARLIFVGSSTHTFFLLCYKFLSSSTAYSGTCTCTYMYPSKSVQLCAWYKSTHVLLSLHVHVHVHVYTCTYDLRAPSHSLVNGDNHWKQLAWIRLRSLTVGMQNTHTCTLPSLTTSMGVGVHLGDCCHHLMAQNRTHLHTLWTQFHLRIEAHIVQCITVHVHSYTYTYTCSSKYCRWFWLVVHTTCP